MSVPSEFTALAESGSLLLIELDAEHLSKQDQAVSVGLIRFREEPE